MDFYEHIHGNNSNIFYGISAFPILKETTSTNMKTIQGNKVGLRNVAGLVSEP